MIRATFGLLTSMLVASPAFAVDVTTCGQTIPRGEIATLQNDVVCTVEPIAITLEKGAKLELAGFDLSGTAGIGVFCPDKKCTIEGRGVIEGGWVAVELADRVRLDMRDVIVRNGTPAIATSGGLGDKNKITLEHVTLEDSGNWAVIAKKIKAEDLTITGTTGGNLSIHALSFVGRDVTLSDNSGFGLSCDKAKVTALTATGNGHSGVLAGRKLKLVDSVVTGNSLVSPQAADIESGKLPKLDNTVCGTSGDRQGGTWGICAND